MYTRDTMCGAPATTVGWRDPGQFYYATISGLEPSTRYFTGLDPLMPGLVKNPS